MSDSHTLTQRPTEGENRSNLFFFGSATTRFRSHNVYALRGEQHTDAAFEASVRFIYACIVGVFVLVDQYIGTFTLPVILVCTYVGKFKF